jgi:hypothetical protein
MNSFSPAEEKKFSYFTFIHFDPPQKQQPSSWLIHATNTKPSKFAAHK